MARFISFEGPDGSGKSTQAAMLVDYLRRRNHAVTATREPGGTPAGESIRELLLDRRDLDMAPLTVALLLSAARYQLVRDVIRPALSRGEIVIADRFADSMVAYQTFASGVPREMIDDLRTIAIAGLEPEATIYVDVAPEVGAERTSRRGAPNRMDDEGLDFHRRVRTGYQELIREASERWIHVDGSSNPQSLHQQIVEKLQPTIQMWEKPT